MIIKKKKFIRLNKRRKQKYKKYRWKWVYIKKLKQRQRWRIRRKKWRITWKRGVLLKTNEMKLFFRIARLYIRNKRRNTFLTLIGKNKRVICNSISRTS